MHLRHSGFTYSPCAYGLFTKSKESIQKFNLMQDWGGGRGGGVQKDPPSSFSPVTSTNVGLSL